MPKKPTTESLWKEFVPNSFLSESHVTDKANQLSSMVDEWFTGYTEYVDPFSWEDEDKHYIRKKAFAELSSYLLNARGIAGEKPLPEIHDLIIDRVNDRRFSHLMSRSPRELHLFSFPYIYAGYVDELEDKTATRLERVINSGAFLEAERVQYRQLEYNFIFKCFSQILGCTQEIYDEETALENSVLNHQPNVVRNLLPDAYCLTHDVFFYNNYNGTFPDVFPDDPAPYDISDVLRGLILRYMAEDNGDIVLELVLAGVLQRQISRQMVQLVLSWVFEKVEDNDYVPGPESDKTAQMKSLDVDEDSLVRNSSEDYQNCESKREENWVKNFHINQIAGMTARTIARDWDKLDKRPTDHSLKVRSNRRDVTRLGELLKSLAKYDLKKGAHQMRELANSPVMTEYQAVSQDAINFLNDQRTLDGNFGYWTKEEIRYTNIGNSSEDFHAKLVNPVSESCQEALEAVETATELNMSR